MENSFSKIQNSVMLTNGNDDPANKQTNSKSPIAILVWLALLNRIFITLYRLLLSEQVPKIERSPYHIGLCHQHSSIWAAWAVCEIWSELVRGAERMFRVLSSQTEDGGGWAEAVARKTLA